MFTRLISSRQNIAFKVGPLLLPLLFGGLFHVTGKAMAQTTVEAPPELHAEPAPGTPPARPAMRNVQEVKLRSLMTSFGVADLETQDSVLNYIVQEEKSRQPLRVRAKKLYTAICGDAEPEANIRGMIEEFKAAVDTDKARHATAQMALDTRINYSKSPRLEGMLLLLGVIGDGPLLMPYGNPAPRAARPAKPAPLPAMQTAPGTGTEDPFAHEFHTILIGRFDKNKNGTVDDDERDELMRVLQIALEGTGLQIEKAVSLQPAVRASANTVPPKTQPAPEEAGQPDAPNDAPGAPNDAPDAQGMPVDNQGAHE